MTKILSEMPQPFRSFVREVAPKIQHYGHVLRLMSVLQRVADGELARVMIFMPPRHGKSELASRLFTAYYLHRYPERFVGLASYGASLAYTLSRSAREYFRAAGGALATEGVEEWQATQGGGMWAAGVGGPITGKGAHLLLVDDPVKNAEEADSPTFREKQKEWWRSTFYTRQEPGAAIVVIQCMSGDTPVLMADGTEIPLRYVKVGDQIATYDNGNLATSRVLQHRSNHNDFVFRIIMTSGKIVRANARHPFLVEEHGQLKWVRLKNLTTGHKIVTVRGSGASGKEKLVRPTVAKTQPSVEDSAILTTKRKSGQMGIVLHQSMQRPTATGISNIGTESAPPSTMRCLRRKMGNALFVGSHQETMYGRTGVENCVLTTVMKRIQSEGCCATTAISPWAMQSLKRLLSLWSNTSDFTSEPIASIEPDGIEEVFDIQVDRTENFIANGLVSHNTRWHEDDLSGWLLAQEADVDSEPEHWHVLCMPAVAEPLPPLPASCTVEPDRRVPGAPLCPERYPLPKLTRIQGKVGADVWSALYQQRPQRAEGNIFQHTWWADGRNRYPRQDRAIANKVVARWQFWDTTLKDAESNDFAACLTLELWPDYRLAVREVYNERLQAAFLPDKILEWAQRYNGDGKLRAVVIEDKGGGTTAIQTLRATAPEWLATSIQEFAPTGTKEYRARQAAIWCARDCILLPFPDAELTWLYAFADPLVGQLFRFPKAAHDDMVDTLSMGVIYLEHLVAEGWQARAGLRNIE